MIENFQSLADRPRLSPLKPKKSSGLTPQSSDTERLDHPVVPKAILVPLGKRVTAEAVGSCFKKLREKCRRIEGTADLA